MISSRKALVAAVAVSSIAAASALNKVGSAVDGIHTVIDGAGNVLSVTADHLENKANQFVDTAGNVYTVLKDVAGNASGLVMNSAGAIFDVTKMAGSFVLNSALSYPGDVWNSAQDSTAELRGALGSVGQVANAMVEAAYKPSLPQMKQMLHPASWIQAGQENWVKSKESLNVLTAAFSAPYSAFEEKYCTPPTLVPSVKEPTTITMPGFKMEIVMGSCTVVNDEAFADCLFNHECPKEALQLDCIKPYVEYGHTAGEIVYKHHTPVEFKNKECKVEKEHGVEEEIVLFEFPSHNVDVKAVADSVSSSIGNAVGQLASSATNLAQDAANFIGGTKHDMVDFQEFVTKYDGMP